MFHEFNFDLSFPTDTDTDTDMDTHIHTTQAHAHAHPQQDFPPLPHITKTYFQITQAVHGRNVVTHGSTTNPPQGE